MSTKILSRSDSSVFTQTVNTPALSPVQNTQNRRLHVSADTVPARVARRLLFDTSDTPSCRQSALHEALAAPRSSDPNHQQFFSSKIVLSPQKAPLRLSREHLNSSSSEEDSSASDICFPRNLREPVHTPLSTPLDTELRLKKEFYSLPQSSSSHTLCPQIFMAGMLNGSRNRYSDILPFEATRFQIPGQPKFYYNANCLLGGTGIAAQGPLPWEHGEFWTMVWHSQTPAIVMLVNLVEGERDKCSQYWPEKAPLHFEEENLTIALREEARNGNTVMRTFTLEKRGETRTVVQYHVTHWPDQGVIDKQELATFVVEMESLSRQHPDNPLLAHCSAGVGRTGTFFAVLEAYKRLKEGKSTPNMVFEIVSQLRTERTCMVQTCEQYILVHDTLELLKSKTDS